MSFKEVIEKLRRQKVGKEQALPVCAVLFLAAVGLSVAMTVGLQACAGSLGAMLGGAAS